MSGIRELPRKDFMVLVAAIMLNIVVFASSVYVVYFQTPPQTVEFKVFEVTVHYWPEIGMNQTQVLTWGEGKFYFIGTWTREFQPDHSYRVTYMRQPGAKRPWQNLVVTEWEEVDVA